MKIFVSIASYQDPLLKSTVESLYNNAKFKDTLTIGVFDQTLDILEFDPWIPVKYKTCNPEDSLGCCWARSRIQKELFTDEDIFMQIDSHTMFKPNWDEYLLKELAKSKQWVQSPILSGYPRPFNVLETKNAFNTNEDYIFVDAGFKDDETHVMTAHSFTEGLYTPLIAKTIPGRKQCKGFFMSGGFIFTESEWVNDVPYDPDIFFLGEEPTLSLRSYTKGYDIVHVPDTPLYHWYNDEKQEVKRELYWDGNADKLPILQAKGRERVDFVLSGNDTGLYGIGTQRTIQDFAKFSGIDYINKTYAPDKALFTVYENTGWEEVLE